jgi:hypothetical protein
MQNYFIRTFLFIFIILLSGNLFAQSGKIKGRVYNEINNEPLQYATVFVQETSSGSYTDSLGNFEVGGLNPGLYNLEVRYAGFAPRVIIEIQVTNSKPYLLDIAMREEETNLDSVVIVASPFKRVEEAPVSLRTIGTNEIARNPGGNRDISKVIQSLPGVGSTVSFRNDILIRGGAPNENRFYLDDIEVPNINHFATQGASGGPVGLINVDFINEVDFYSGAFPANRGNALSSVFLFGQRQARDDRVGFTATVGASDLALTVEGPIKKESSFMFSARRSYLQLLFKVLGLPFLPNYNDYQLNTRIKLNDRNELRIVSLGALDQFELNLDADSTDFQKYILGNIPVQSQWNYTFGVSYRHYADNGFLTVVLSRNMINYDANKYVDNEETNRLLFDYNSREIENKSRIEYTGRRNGYKWNYGVNMEHAKYTNRTFQEVPFGTIDFESKLNLFKYGVFAQASKSLMKDRLILSLGARMDGNSFSEEMQNPLNQFSPRFSASYAINSKLSANFNTGIFYQLPPYTVLGYRDTDSGALVNKENGIRYIRNKQIVGGFSWTSPANSKISIEGFYKDYDNYPFLLNDSISLANLGGDFGVIGNEPAASISEGRAYGLEFLYQQRLFKGFYGILAYTLFWSEFQDNKGEYIPSSWDSRHIIALTAGKKFRRNWEIGAKWRFTGGTPFTPADVDFSRLTEVWDVRGSSVPDYSRLNSDRIPNFHQLDVRVDKKWFFQKWSLNLFLDIQNVYNKVVPGPPILDVVRDENSNYLIDPNDPSRYQTYLIENDLGLLQPTVGIVVTY